MGRGRAKAKQTKVARALKYSNQEPDLQRLQQELTSAPERDGYGGRGASENSSDEDDDDDDTTCNADRLG
ncbi:MAG: DUF3073 domain-containing protein [Mycobacteriales bacterium]